jgi:hypothetical protein
VCTLSPACGGEGRGEREAACRDAAEPGRSPFPIPHSPPSYPRLPRGLRGGFRGLGLGFGFGLGCAAMVPGRGVILTS